MILPWEGTRVSSRGRIEMGTHTTTDILRCVLFWHLWQSDLILFGYLGDVNAGQILTEITH